MPNAALSLDSITRRFRAGVPGCSAEVTALSDISLQVMAGECVAIIGPAGSGKSTLLLCAAGVLVPDSGQVKSAHCVYAPPHGVAHPYLGVQASLEFAASLRELRGENDEPDIAALLDRTGLAGLERARIGTLTPGMRARAAVAHLLLESPAVICLDDPLGPLSNAERRRFSSLTAELCGTGMAIVISARDPDWCDGIASRAVMLSGGRIIEALRPRRTLEIEVRTPQMAVSALSARLPSVRQRGRAVRVALDRISAEEVLAACVALGINVTGSRVINVSGAAGRVAEGGDET